MSYKAGPRIRKYREATGLSPKELAELLPVSNLRVSNWELGINRPDVDTIVKTCEALKVFSDELLDIRLSSGNMTDQERQVLTAYRAKPDLQHAVNILLGVDESAYFEHLPFPF